MNKDDLRKYGTGTLIIFTVTEAIAVLSCIPIFHDSNHLLPIFWIITGFFISIGLGTYFVGRIREFFAKDIKKNLREKVEKELAGRIIPELDEENPSCHLDWLLGVVERFVFTFFVAVSLKNAIAPMGGWIALKLAASWRRRSVDKPYELLLIRLLTLNALMNSVISLCFAVLGGSVTAIGIRLVLPNFSDICWGNLLSLFH
jgi:hypothetical protein